MAKSVLFVSTVREWGGSEILWAEAATTLADNGHNVICALRYQHPIIEKLKHKGASYINTSQADAPPFVERVLRKARIKRHPFLHALSTKKPQLVVISQGSNVDARYYMTVCRERGTPYVTVTQLVANLLWAFIDDKIINELRAGYAQARCNYFVSRTNVDLHNLMIGDEQPNAKVILNPFTVPVEVQNEYPPVVDGQYQIALVGRLEAFHKGHDLLLQVLRQSKWKDRPVIFNLYGSGPHRQLLERLLKIYGISNIVFKGYVNDVADIWKNNHFLVMPSRMEGQALALIEAMWCYRGAVVSDVGGAKELITDGETGFVADFPTVRDIDGALEKAWSTRERWEEIGKNAGRKIREIYGGRSASLADELQQVLG